MDNTLLDLWRGATGGAPAATPSPTPSPTPMPGLPVPGAASTPGPQDYAVLTGQQPAPPVRAGPDLRGIAGAALSGLNAASPAGGTLGTLLTKLPMGRGIYTRLLDGEVSEDDREYIVQTMGIDPSPEWVNGVLQELLSSFFGSDPSASIDYARSISPPARVAIDAARAAGGFVGSNLSPAGAAGPGAAGMPFGAGQVTPREMQGLDIPTGIGSISQPEGTASPSNVLRTTKLKGPTGQDIDALFQPGSSNPFAIWDTTDQRYRLAVDPTDANLDLAARSGYFSQDYLMSLRTTNNALLKSAQEYAYADANNELSVEEKKLSIAVLKNQISREKALEQYNIALAAANTRKAEIDAELGAIELKLAPLAVKERQMALAKTEMELEQSRQSFPLDLQMKREQLASAQFSRQLQERQLKQSALDDEFAGQAYGMLMGALTGGPAGGPSPRAAPGAAPAAPAAPTAPAPATGGPPAIFGQLAQGAGVDPNDPAAQMAFALLQNQAETRQGAR